LSFSLYGADNDGGKSPQLQWHFLRLFLQSVGIVLTDIQDVIFKYLRHLSTVLCFDKFIIAVVNNVLVPVFCSFL